MVDKKPEKKQEKQRPDCEACHCVPQVRSDRDRLIAAIDTFAAEKNLSGQLDASVLTEYALQILTDAGAETAWRKWVMVHLNNACWRSRLCETPPSQRLLLLPDCLRDESKCTATLDPLGLLCARCGSCPLNTFLDTAENLGYVTLVSEGTAAVLSVIKTGRVKAFVGVSCLSTLEKVFPFMAMLGVPALAFPLHKDGCEATSVDIDRVLAAIRLGVPA